MVQSLNEPPGSDVLPGVPHPTDPLDLVAIDPASVAVGSAPDFLLTVTGTGFTPVSVIVFDDEEQPTTFVNITTLIATVPVAAAPATVDVEVHRGEELSDVLTFEFTAASGGARSAPKPVQRKPKKPAPRWRR